MKARREERREREEKGVSLLLHASPAGGYLTLSNRVFQDELEKVSHLKRQDGSFLIRGIGRYSLAIPFRQGKSLNWVVRGYSLV